MNTDKMPAGRELDALVSKHVMTEPYYWADTGGIERSPVRWGDKQLVPDFSTDIAAAWWLLDRFGFVVGPRFDPGWGERPRNGWYVYRNWEDTARDAFSEDGGECALAEAETLPLAICRAALKAVAS